LTENRAKGLEREDFEDEGSSASESENERLRLRMLIDNMPLGCTLQDSANNIIACSNGALRLFREPDRKKFIKNFWSYCPEFQPDGQKSQEKARELYRKTIETGEQKFEWMYRTATGEPLPTETVFVYVGNKRGDYYIGAYSRDLTEAKASEEEMREAEERVRAMLDSTPMAISMWDEEGKMLDCNLEALRLLELDQKIDYIEHFYDLQPARQPDGEKTLKKAQKLIRAAFETGYQRFDWLYQTASGKPLPVETILVRLPWKGKYRLAAYSRDLREIKMRELEAREADDRVYAMLDSLIIGCVFFDEKGEPVDCNERAVKLFHCRDKKDYLRKFYSFFPERQPDGSNSREKAHDMIHRAYKEEQVAYFWEHMTSDGNLLPSEVTLRRVKWRDEWRVVAYIRDLSAIREANDRAMDLEVESRSARAASEAKSNFLASMSHEIRTPMNAIIGMSDLMRTDNLDEQQLRYLRDIRGTSHLLLQLLNDILDFSKIEAGKMDLTPVNFSIHAMYDNICSLTKILLRNKFLQFRSSFAKDLPKILYGDDVRLQQIVLNLINNAVKYTQEGYVELQMTREKRQGHDWLVITVKDTGLGIKKENLPRLFGRFQRLDTRENRGITGTGLGLAITRQLVELMKGEISVESEYGKGSTFTVRIPLVEGEENESENSAKEGTRVEALPDAAVLVVDDSPINLTVAQGYLAQHYIKAETAASGMKAMEMIQAKPYDLVFMDHMMPEMDGIETTRRIRELSGDRFRRMPIVALSANAVSGMRETFINAGMNDFLIKPIDPRALNKVLAVWLPKEKVTFVEAYGSEEKTAEPRDCGEENPGGGQGESNLVIDEKKGLANIQGDEKLYMRILEDFSQFHASDFTSITSSLNNGNAIEARRLAHTLKSSAAAVGAERLKRIAEAVETELTQNSVCRGKTLEPMEEELSLVLDEVSQILSRAEKNRKDDSVLDREKALALLEKLEPLLDTCSSECVDMEEEIRITLSPLGQPYEVFAGHLQNLDFFSALETLPDLRRAIADAPDTDSA
jgi:PAS domain S-box-containing protein